MDKKLDDLVEAMNANDPTTLDVHGDARTDLPVFGGEEPACTEMVWSWDDERLLITNSVGEYEIVSRADWDDEHIV